MKSPLLKYSNNIYSQNGEDGIIYEILQRLGLDSDGWVCEFGAWDGKHLSNTFALVEQGFNAVYIEGDEEKFKDLIRTKNENPNIVAINEYVSRNNLDILLKNTDIPKKFTLLSIDIDSYDLEVWKNFELYQPIIVVIEINSSISPNIEHIHSNSLSGNSFKSTLKIGREKGYHLVCHTGNCIFVHSDYINKIKLPVNLLDNPEKLFLTKYLPASGLRKYIQFIKNKLKA